MDTIKRRPGLPKPTGYRVYRIRVGNGWFVSLIPYTAPKPKEA